MSPRGHGAGGPGPGTTALRLLPRLSAAALVRPINTPCHVSQHHYFYTTEKSKKKTNHYLEHEQDSCGEAAEPISLPAPSPAGRQRRGPVDGSCSPPAPATGEHQEWGRTPGPKPLPDEPAPGRTRQMRCVRTAPHASSAPQHPSGHAAQYTKICSSKEKKLCKTRIQCEKLFSKLAFASAEQLSSSSRGQPRTGRGWLTTAQVAFISCSKSQRRKAKPLILEKLVCAEPLPPPGLPVASPPSRARRMPTAPGCTKLGCKSGWWGARGHPHAARAGCSPAAWGHEHPPTGGDGSQTRWHQDGDASTSQPAPAQSSGRVSVQQFHPPGIAPHASEVVFWQRSVSHSRSSAACTGFGVAAWPTAQAPHCCPAQHVQLRTSPYWHPHFVLRGGAETPGAPQAHAGVTARGWRGAEEAAGG